MRRGGTEVTAERLQNTIGLRCEGTTPERGCDPGERKREGERVRESEREGESVFPDLLLPLQDLFFCLTNTFTHFLLTGHGLRVAGICQQPIVPQSQA